jgi:hypothetical protein
MRIIGLFSVLIVLMLSGCNTAPEQPAAPPPPQFKPTISIAEIMEHVIMPNADLLWGSLETNVTVKGIEEKMPRTDEDWERVRNYAVTLVEATNLLLVPGRRVEDPGGPAHDPSELTGDQIEARIKQDPVMWTTHVHKLHDVAMESVQAVNAKSIDALLKAGETLDEACESCHLVYWYPPKS